MVRTNPEQVANELAAAIHKMAKKHYPAVEAPIVNHVRENIWVIVVESPYQIAENMADIVNQSKHGHLRSTNEIPGVYDWASDTYIRDASSVTLQIKP